MLVQRKMALEQAGRLFIGGEWVEPSGAGGIDLISPSTEEVFLTVAAADGQDMERAVSAARQAFDEGPWPRLSHQERAVFLRAMGAAIATRSEQIGALWSSEIGIVNSLATAYSQFTGAVYDYHATLADSFPFEERHVPPLGGKLGLLVHEPVGVVAAIVPWNVPVLLAAWKVAPALLAGCTVVLKMSPEAPTSGYILAEIARQIGLPPGVLNVVTAGREVSELLVRNPGVDKVSFTGSTAAGRKIASICGERMARCTLELGGKSAAIVLDDFDVDTAADTLAASAPNVTGQVCAALTRIIVSRERHDALVDALADRFRQIRVGDPFDPETRMGPLATARQRDRVEGYIASGRGQGATLVTGGGRPKGLERGFYVEPTIFSNVDNDMIIAREEIFGPVLSVIPARDEDEAVRIANDSEFGLNASIFTNDAARAYRAARRLRTGTVGHNELRVEMFIAAGGFKQSGIGREGGIEGLRAFLEPKTIILNEDPALQPEARTLAPAADVAGG